MREFDVNKFDLFEVNLCERIVFKLGALKFDVLESDSANATAVRGTATTAIPSAAAIYVECRTNCIALTNIIVTVISYQISSASSACWPLRSHHLAHDLGVPGTAELSLTLHRQIVADLGLDCEFTSRFGVFALFILPN